MKMLISKLNLNESFICSIWENQDNYSELRTIDGRPVEVIEHGFRNPDAGPDYVNAKVSIDGRIYCGSVEIHRECGDWHRHSHRKDSKYSEVILHVAMFDDSPGQGPAKAKRSREIPTVILSNHLTRSIREIWKELISNRDDKISLPCFPSVLKTPYAIRKSMIDSLSQQRLGNKSGKIAQRIMHLAETSGITEANEQALFEYVCEALGFSKNKNQFIRLARGLDVQSVKISRPGQIECDSIVFGMAGFLQGLRIKDEYAFNVKSTWNTIGTELNLPQMNPAEWNFFRLRPVNFPTLRLAFASGLLYYMSRNTFSDIVKSILSNSDDPYPELVNLLKNIPVSEYWQYHYHFGKKRKLHARILGDQRISDIMENVLIPFSYSAFSESPELKERISAIYRSSKITGGKSLLTRWLESETGFRIRTLGDEQGIIQLHKEFCLQKRCDECEIGKAVFSEKAVEDPMKIILY